MPSAKGIHYSLHRSDRKDRPPLVYLHGAGGNLLTWHPYLRRLEGETAYALDLPGHGASSGEGRNSIEEYAADVLRFLDALEIPQMIPIGISMGGAIALTLALNEPARIAAFVLLGSGAKMRVAHSILESAGNPATFESAVETINSNCFSRHAPRDLLRLSKRQMLKLKPSVLLGDFTACDQFDVSSRLAEIEAPALILCGALDAMMPPKFSESLHAGMPHSQLHIVEQAGHMLQLEQPGAVASLLKGFLDNLPPRLQSRA
jgi:pimeloyl-ACP methyl ester carboxylesterase